MRKYRRKNHEVLLCGRKGYRGSIMTVIDIFVEDTDSFCDEFLLGAMLMKVDWTKKTLAKKLEFGELRMTISIYNAQTYKEQKNTYRDDLEYRIKKFFKWLCDNAGIKFDQYDRDEPFFVKDITDIKDIY